VSHVVVYGVVVFAGPMSAKVPDEAGFTWNWTDATPEVESAALVDATGTDEPKTVAALAGDVTLPEGAVPSYLKVDVPVPTFPAVSVQVRVTDAATLSGVLYGSAAWHEEIPLRSDPLGVHITVDLNQTLAPLGELGVLASVTVGAVRSIV